MKLSHDRARMRRITDAADFGKVAVLFGGTSAEREISLVSGRAEGTGLGLAMAQQVAREHRGSLAFRSRPGHTVFTLLLPYGEAADDAA